MFDRDLDVARTAIRSAAAGRPGDLLFVPASVSLLRHRVLKPAARDVLVSYGGDVLDALAYFLRDRDEDVWVAPAHPGDTRAHPDAAVDERSAGRPERSRTASCATR